MQILGQERKLRGIISCCNSKLDNAMTQPQQINKSAANHNKESGLPVLIGSEKQVAWAEIIRKNKTENIEENIDKRLFNTARRELTLEKIKNTTSASWWIDRRDKGAAGIFKEVYNETDIPSSQQEMESIEKIKNEILAESTIRPENPKSETVAEISFSEKKIAITFNERNEDFRKLVKFELKYAWNNHCWIKTPGSLAGNIIDIAAETGHKLLGAGFIIRCFNELLRKMIATGKYEPEHRLIISKSMSDKFVIRWPRDNDFYHAAKNISSARYSSNEKAIIVPSEQYEEVLDFAKMYNFWLSPGAIELTESAKQIRHNSLIVKIEAINDKSIDHNRIPNKLEAPEKVEIDDEFIDTD